MSVAGADTRRILRTSRSCGGFSIRGSLGSSSRRFLIFGTSASVKQRRNWCSPSSSSDPKSASRRAVSAILAAVSAALRLEDRRRLGRCLASPSKLVSSSSTTIDGSRLVRGMTTLDDLATPALDGNSRSKCRGAGAPPSSCLTQAPASESCHQVQLRTAALPLLPATCLTDARGRTRNLNGKID